ncbi:hypothetical protein AK88_02084 [Plasmodium fragile]|uniref:Tryptophan/threonine-rich plasmodium antigen C-terminal domain-containing protein n=1 Tax=Plasmodium fragile TaxID=5857 RepID=A0A0D9QMZ9_PLAFR|nr:uncharacterized protein AK88_02084 [Plasmodium fragile]KJP88303.1 hypothetical protein AK88_02084 [Plasmodium fragile]
MTIYIFIKNVRFQAPENEKIYEPYIPGSIKKLDEEGVHNVHEWKMKKWSEFMKSMEGDFNDFLEYLKNEKNSWLEKKGEMWEQWKAEMEKKWEQYKADTFNELLATDQEAALNWSDDEWTNWANTKGKTTLKEEYEKWINDQYEFYKEGIANDWNNWNDFKKKEFEGIQWKACEDKYWKKYWLDINPGDNLYEIKTGMYKKWQERVQKEEEEWAKWVEEKHKAHIDVEWDKWEEWKKENSKHFTEWMDAFFQKWIENKQWNVWTQAKKNVDVVESY